MLKKNEVIAFIDNPANKAGVRGNDLGLEIGDTIEFNCKFISDDPDFVPNKIPTGDGAEDWFNLVNVVMKCIDDKGIETLNEVSLNLEMKSLIDTNLDKEYGVQFVGKENKAKTNVYGKSNFRIDRYHAV